MGRSSRDWPRGPDDFSGLYGAAAPDLKGDELVFLPRIAHHM